MERWTEERVMAIYGLRVARLDAESGTRLGDSAYVGRLVLIVKALADEAGWPPEELARTLRLQIGGPDRQ
jgi:hypothetical protein